jgi:DNA repair protein RAD50
MQHLEEALVPLSEERESLLQEYKALKERPEQEFEQLAERKRGFQQEIDELGTLNTQIKEYTYFFHSCSSDLSHFY